MGRCWSDIFATPGCCQRRASNRRQLLAERPGLCAKCSLLLVQARIASWWVTQTRPSCAASKDFDLTLSGPGGACQQCQEPVVLLTRAQVRPRVRNRGECVHMDSYNDTDRRAR